MSTLRLDYQRLVVRQTPGTVLNMGCNTDPANLQKIFGERVVNHDFVTYDEWLKVDLPVDVTFDITGLWPSTLGDFFDKSGERFDLVVMGDILEHVEEQGAVNALAEARKWAKKLCITVPNDDRLGPGWNSDGTRRPESEWVEAPGSYHVQQVTAEKLRSWLEATGWKVTNWCEVPYGFCPVGYFVTAE